MWIRGTSMDQQFERQTRVNVDISVTITTVLDSFEASIVDLTEDGALVTGCSLTEGTRFQIEYMGETIYAQCRWAEVDRMGIRFIFSLDNGALHERLVIARASQISSEAGGDAFYSSHPRAFTRLQMTGGFGKRSA
jgi:hypothetical protein